VLGRLLRGRQQAGNIDCQVTGATAYRLASELPNSGWPSGFVQPGGQLLQDPGGHQATHVAAELRELLDQAR